MSRAWFLDVRTLLPAVVLVAIGGGPGCIAPITVMGALEPYYSKGDLAKNYGDRAHALASVGCIEVAPSVREADGEVIVDMRMGNRCGDAVSVDLTKLAITASVEESSETSSCVVSDPNGEIRPLPLPGRGRAFEPLALDKPYWVKAHPTARLCLDVSSIAAHDGEVPPLCFSRREARWFAARAK